MTDIEVIKGLVCCRDLVPCKSYCPYAKYKCTIDRECIPKLCEDALDLITRQKADIEALQRENAILMQNADTAFQDGLNEAQDLYARQIRAETRAEVAKEFAEKIKKALYE